MTVFRSARKTNLVITGPDTHPTIKSDQIDNAIEEDGIAILDGAWPSIDSCVVSTNARHGIAVWQVDTLIHCPSVQWSVISNNGTGGFGDGIQLIEARVLVRHNIVSSNMNAGISVNNGSELKGALAYGDDASNTLSDNEQNLFLDQGSICSFGLTVPNNNSYGNLNCFNTPTIYQVAAHNGSVANVEEDYFDPDQPQWFYVDATSVLSTQNTLMLCTHIPGAPRIETQEGGLEQKQSWIEKASLTADIKQAMDYLARGRYAESKQVLLSLLASNEMRQKDAALTVYSLLYSRTGDISLIVSFLELKERGKISANMASLFMARIYRWNGMYGSALRDLSAISDSLEAPFRKTIELEKAYLHSILSGKEKALRESERLVSQFNGDNIVHQVAGYLRWVVKRADRPDTLTKRSLRNTKAFPDGYKLLNHPNPFNPTTQITFTIPDDGLVRISVLDILGREIDVLVDEDRRQGSYTVTFNGAPYPSGLYICRMVAGDIVVTRKMSLMK